VTGEESTRIEKLANMMRTPYYHVWTSTDMIGVEVSVAMKNVYALAVGLVNGLLEQCGSEDGGAVMHNLAAALFAQGLREIAYMVDYAGGDVSSAYGLPGAGDLYVTSMGGRNGRMGRWLGMGVPYSKAKKEQMPDDTIEGAALITAIGPTVERLFDREQLDGEALPLLQAMIDIVCHDGPPNIPWDAFFHG
jgi:glycerol-3-phosphate dehydrogenase (NAD(P)+)